MWAMATQFANPKGQMYVTNFDATPKLHVKQMGSLRESFALSFGESLVRYGKDLKAEFLASAYKRAGTSIGRLLEEHFVVLNDKMRPTFNRRNHMMTKATTTAAVTTAAMSTPATTTSGKGVRTTGGTKRKGSRTGYEEERKKGRSEHSEKKKKKEKKGKKPERKETN